MYILTQKQLLILILIWDTSKALSIPADMLITVSHSLQRLWAFVSFCDCF